ncbi:MAG: preprotein translocase subunit SecA, partial [Candidatus Azotimanducaceae bacterium]
MVMQVFNKIFGSKNDRELKRMGKVVTRINDLESTFEAFSDVEIANLRNLYSVRLGQGESLDAILPEAFAAVREAGKRALGLRIFDV